MRTAVFIAAILGAVACGKREAPAPRHSEAMERSARMLRAMDRLEADLHAIDGEHGTYTELVVRHGRAQEIACKVTDDHVEEIHRLAALQEQKIQQKKLDRLRKKKAVASLTPRHGRS